MTRFGIRTRTWPAAAVDERRGALRQLEDSESRSRLSGRARDRGGIQSVKKITLDTNVLPANELLACAERLGLDVAVVSVTEREVEGTPFEVELRPLVTVNETGVYGEARYGRAVTHLRRRLNVSKISSRS